MGSPHRFTQDYKSLDYCRTAGPFAAIPWFIAGVGIPLICLAFVLPKNDSDSIEPMDLVEQPISLADIGEQARPTALDEADTGLPAPAAEITVPLPQPSPPATR